jgi:UDP-2-acetamido-2-deoxy-ribo-hexuluronate aminotransferase
MLKDSVVTPAIAEGNSHVYAQYTVRVDGGCRDEIVAGMKESGIPVGVYYPTCFHEQPVFEELGYAYGDFPESERASSEVLSLPMHPFLTMEEQKVITNTLKERL